ncbi:MAG: alpha/beta hydrolase [Ketobacter sp.]|nr:MAG: alpha/beta hydrolase [Ketobacter sp.]
MGFFLPGMKHVKPLLRHLMLACLYWVLGLLAGGAWLLGYVVDARPDLEPWHEVVLQQEYDHHRHRDFQSLAQYQQLEAELFAELEQTIYSAPGPLPELSRYRHGSRVDPTAYPENGNRTLELTAAEPRGGVLLLHGLSDSPYSLLTLARSLNRHGYHVVVLRLPGHGTVPSGLLNASAEDFRAAVRLAMRHLRQSLAPALPIHMVGYSNGAALAVDYALDGLQASPVEPLPAVARLVLISPAIGVSRLAELAPWQRRVAALPGFGKLAWQSVQPEYDPFKYNSFSLNAAEQVYRLTQSITQRLEQARQTGQLERFPPTQVFTSAVDATVSVAATVQGLMGKLSGDQYQLVMYDVNQESNTRFLFAPHAVAVVEQLLAQTLPFRLEVLTNGPTDSARLVRQVKAAGADEVLEQATDLVWPASLYSLSHVALPFAPSDPVYGDVPTLEGRPQSLGNVTLRGERGVLQVPLNQLMRLRYNPFYDDQEQRILTFLDRSFP